MVGSNIAETHRKFHGQCKRCEEILQPWQTTEALQEQGPRAGGLDTFGEGMVPVRANKCDTRSLVLALSGSWKEESNSFVASATATPWIASRKNSTGTEILFTRTARTRRIV